MFISGVCAGVCLGIVLRLFVPPFQQPDLHPREMMYLYLPAEILLRMMTLLALPLVISSLISAIGNPQNYAFLMCEQQHCLVVRWRHHSNLVAYLNFPDHICI